MAKEYELGLVLRPDLDEERQQSVIARYRQVIETHGGSLEEPNIWGKRRLAYEIKDLTEGVYIFLLYTADASANAELDRLLRIDDNVLRFMAVVRPRPNPPKPTSLPEAGPGAHAEGSRPTSGERQGPGLPEPRRRPAAQGVGSMPTPAPTSEAASGDAPAAPAEPAAAEPASEPTESAPTVVAVEEVPASAPAKSAEVPAADEEPTQD